MTEKPHPPSTQTATPHQSLPSKATPSPIPPPHVFPPATSDILPPPSSSPSSSAAAAPPTAAVTTNGIAPSVHVGGETKAEPAAEEEPYTIKCICGYTGDDGNTIYCDRCDSWQHIECFYPNNSEEATREEFSHACYECEPRPLNQKHAVAYQQQRLEAATAETAETPKPKRPPSKSHGQSHKKKPKPTDLQLNGHGHTPSASDVAKHLPPSAHDQPHSAPVKKPKSAHKSSQSVGGSHHKKSPSYSAARANFQNGQPLSPATTPPDLPDGTEGQNFSSDFLSLCNEQSAVQTVRTNSFASLSVSNTTSIWLREPQRMYQETGHTYKEVFHELPLGEAPRRSPQVEVKNQIITHDPIVRWSYLAMTETVAKSARLVELNGQVGFQNIYCDEPINRYEELSCPLPFVFFHPLLPLYIDTRREGSWARYVRRSCRPNATLETFLSEGSEYHFWLVSERQIEAGEKVTLAWDFRLPNEAKARMLRILGLGDEDSGEEVDLEEEEYNSIARWVHLVLSEYGGCACDLGTDCAFSRFRRAYGSRVHQTSKGHSGSTAGQSKKKTSRKSKSHALSPTSTGPTTNSRAPSEGHLDDLTENDKMSTTSRSKPPSRDMTPAPRQGSFDTLGILTEPTDRDKRKVAMVEDSFRRLEQQPPRKKKRTSDGTSTSDRPPSGHSKSKSKGSPSTNAPSHANGDHPEHANGLGAPGRTYVDVGTSRSKTNSPISVASPQFRNLSGPTFTPMLYGKGDTPAASRHASMGPPSTYCDAAVQTEPTVGEWYSEIKSSPCPKRRVVSLSRRLLGHRLLVRQEQEQELKQKQEQEQEQIDNQQREREREREQEQERERKQEQPEKEQPPVGASSEMDVDTKDTLPPVEAVAPTAPAAPAEAISPDNALAMDVPMPDAHSAPVITPAESPRIESKPIPPATPLPKKAGGVNGTAPETSQKSPGLQTSMPLVPPTHGEMKLEDSVPPATQSGAPASVAVGASVPQPLPLATINTSAINIAAINGASMPTPSPVKKKMSLSDYTKSRKASRPSTGTPLKSTTAATVEELKSAPGADGVSANHSPTTVEKTPETVASAGTPAAPAAPAVAAISE